MRTIDQWGRVAFAAVVIVLNFMGKLDGAVGTFLMGLSACLLITSMLGFSPLYYLISKFSNKQVD